MIKNITSANWKLLVKIMLADLIFGEGSKDYLYLKNEKLIFFRIEEKFENKLPVS